MTDAPSIYAKARADVAGMLGYDLDNLTAEQATRLDIATALRVLLDNQSGRLLRGESLDARELLMASDALAKILPPLRELPPPANRPDPRQIMWETYVAMRRRGELAASYLSPQQRLEAARAKVAEIEAELAALAPPPDEPSAGGANAPGGGNVVRLSRPPSAPASSPPAAPPSKPFVNGTSDLVARYAVPDEPWRQHLNASYDPWADNRR